MALQRGWLNVLVAGGCILSFADAARAQQQTTYTYDALGRLDHVAYGGGESADYAYDAAGNRTSVTNSGAAAGQTLNGTAGADTLVGGSGGDTLNGLAGDDWLKGAAGSDTINGGDGWDTADCDGAPTDHTFVQLAGGVVQVTHIASGDIDLVTAIEGFWFTGTSTWMSTSEVLALNGGQTITGTAGDDYLSGSVGADTISGLAGNDSLYGDAGADTLNGGDDWDTVNYDGGPGDYSFTQQSGGVVQVTHISTGTIDMLTSIEAVWFTGTEQWFGIGEMLAAGTGNQTITGTSGDDDLAGGAGDDTISALAGSDTLKGNSGSDALDGGADWDTADYDGAPGDYTYQQSGGVVQVTHTATGDIDALTSIEGFWFVGIQEWLPTSEVLELAGGDQTITGTSGADYLVGGAGDDTISALAGNDSVKGAGGSDELDGGADWDTADYDGASTDYTFVLLSGGVIEVTHTSSGDIDLLTDIEAAWFEGEQQWYEIGDLLP